jgi:hydrogenase 3 maturation protease
MSLPEELAKRLSGRVAVVGVGNPLRGDDAAGCLLAQRLRGSPGLQVIEAEEVPESYIGDIVAARPDTVAFVDATDLGASAGAIAVLDQRDVALFAPTTHRLPLSLVMDVVRCRTGANVFLIALQPSRTGFGMPVSHGVVAGVELLASLLSELLQAPATPPRAPATAGMKDEKLA